MKRYLFLSLILYFAVGTVASAQKVRVKTGIEVLQDEHFRRLEGKRVGLITNPTGVDHRLRSTTDILHEAPNVRLVALYGPEHGVRGNVHAGDTVGGTVDLATGLPIHSLYGNTRKPTPDMLRGIDILIYDIQDIGCRSFTYISTMGLAMEAAAEAGIEFMVLDRPNPLGGERVEGCIVEDGYKSFVSPYPIPYVYGLTCGELARLLNEERMIGQRCRLQVVKMKGWRRRMSYAETGLPWVLPSPHIPHPETAHYYPATGILGELGTISIGVGYTLPFQLFAAPWINGPQLARRMNTLRVPGVIFRPIYLKPFYALFKGEFIQGIQVHLINTRHAPLSELQFLVMQEAASLYPNHSPLQEADSSRLRMFDKVCGSPEIRRRFTQRFRWNDVRDYWMKDVVAFRRLSRKYYLYK
jgi:hypothetical protein